MTWALFWLGLCMVWAWFVLAWFGVALFGFGLVWFGLGIVSALCFLDFAKT